jgi:hypothetical protein
MQYLSVVKTYRSTYMVARLRRRRLYQKAPCKVLQCSSILLTILDDNLLLVPTMACIVVSHKVMCKLVAIRAEPTVQRSQLSFFSLASITVQRYKPSQIEEQTPVQIESHRVRLLIKEDVHRSGIDAEDRREAKDEW